MISFLLNDSDVSLDLMQGEVLLDALRSHLKLTGTKEGCREGDCGACMVLVGTPKGKSIDYAPANSCLFPVGEIQGKHVVTIEGLNRETLTPIQQAIVDEGATQCGFCAPGIIVALTSYLINCDAPDAKMAEQYLDGNICRCTGYISIRRATERICDALGTKSFLKAKTGPDRIKLLVRHGILPDYFLNAGRRLKKIGAQSRRSQKAQKRILVAGGTDLLVQKPEEIRCAKIEFASHDTSLRKIRVHGSDCEVGGATVFEEICKSDVFQKFFPHISERFAMIASTPIRARATVAGNIVNASPIGDLSILFLALDANLKIAYGRKSRDIPLKDFFKGYKRLDLKKGEIVTSIRFKIPVKGTKFNFEKISRRKHLDIASVNSAILIHEKLGIIDKVNISAGGVAPVPLFLKKTSAMASGKKITIELVKNVIDSAANEISPITDVRGSAEYKRLLLRNLIAAHFLKLFPDKINMKDVL